MGKLTDVGIKALIRTGKPVAKSDGDGLTFTMSARQAAARAGSWVLRYRFGRRQRELTIGNYPDIGLGKARELAAEARVRIQQGDDVAREKKRVLVERAVAKSMRELAEDYMEKKFPDLAANTIKQRRSHIEKIVLRRLGSVAARDVSTADVVDLIEGVGRKSVNVAELVFTALSEIFKHGLARHVVTATPCAGLSVSAICGRAPAPRARLKLTEAELRAIFAELPMINEQNALSVKILLATCVRIGELARAQWDHIDVEKREWFIPDENSKGGKGFTVPLADVVVQWFEQLRTLACGSRFVLPARQRRRVKNHGGEEMHFEPRALNAMLHKLCDKLDGRTRRFTPHDLRSTARSHLTALGTHILVAERCLNHSLGGLVGIYDQHDYMEERRRALSRWADFLQCCEDGREWAESKATVVALAYRTAA